MNYFAEITTNTENDNAVLSLPNDKSFAFENMQQLAEWSDSLKEQVTSWRADERQKRAQGIRKLIYDITVAGMKKQIEQINPEAAAHFPDDVFVGGEWIIDAKEDEEDMVANISIHVKSLILLVADIFGNLREGTTAPKSNQPQTDVAELVKKL